MSIMRRLAAWGFFAALFGAWSFVACNTSTHPDELKSEVPNATFNSSGDAGKAHDENFFCQCIGTLSDSDNNKVMDCANCLMTAANGECSTVATKCQADPNCVSVFDCLAVPPATSSGPGCGYTPSCIAECLFPLNADEGRALEAMALGCGCEACASKCVPSMPLTCTAPSSSASSSSSSSSTGGAGGSGVGGAGGAGP